MPTSRTRPGTPGAGLRPIAAIEVDVVSPSNQGFTLTGEGTGADRSQYRLDIRFDLPLDPRTRTVLAELLSQSDITVYRSETPLRNS